MWDVRCRSVQSCLLALKFWLTLSSAAAQIAAAAPPPVPINTGDSDVSPDNTPSQYLLFRSLESTVGEELLAKGAAKLLRSDDAELPKEDSQKSANAKVSSTSAVAQAGARPGCIRRVLLIRDRRTNDSWRYGFIEFAAVEDAQAALAKFLSITRFTIASKPVIVSYVHAGVFVPYLQPSPDTEQFTFPASTNPALKLTYWDQNGWASALIISTGENDPEKKPSISSKDDTATTKPKKRKADTNTTPSEAKPKKQMASHLQFWAKRGAELRGIAEPFTTGSISAGTTPDNSPAPPTQSYADPAKHCCYLCARQFKSAAEVNKHERLSELHRTNLKVPDTVDKARDRLQKAGIFLVDSVRTNVPDEEGDKGQEQEYRDRARERRRTHAQPKNAAAASTTNSKPITATHTTSTPTDAPQQAPPKSKAALMLAKMGHTPGTGLGASATGTTNAIETNVYAQGVGLGASGGKLGDAVVVAEKATRGEYRDFVDSVRERARERFESEK